MAIVNLQRLRALENQEGTALDQQLDVIIAYIMTAEGKQITRLDMTINHYDGPHYQILRVNLVKRKNKLCPQIWGSYTSEFQQQNSIKWLRKNTRIRSDINFLQLLSRLYALDRLRGNELNQQLVDIALLIAQATPQQINDFSVNVALYLGPYKQNFMNIIAKRKSQLGPQIKTLQKQPQVSQTKESNQKFSLWRCLGFGGRKQQKEQPSMLSSLKALDQLDGEQMQKQVAEVMRLINKSTRDETNEFDMILDHYQGAHKQNLENRARKQDRYLSSYYSDLCSDVKRKLQQSMYKPSGLVKFQLWRCLGIGGTKRIIMSYLTRFNALDQLKESAKNAQLTAMARLIAHTTPKEINDIEMALNLYEGPHKQNFEKNIAKRKDQLRPYKYMKAIERQNSFQLWHCLGFGRNKKQQEHPSLLTCLNTLDQLDGVELDKQLKVINYLIGKVPPDQIEVFATAIEQYEGPHQQSILSRISQRKRKIYAPWSSKDQHKDKLMQFKIKSKSKARAKAAEKPQIQQQQIAKSQQEQLKVQQQTQSTNHQSQSKVQEKEVQHQSVIQNINNTQDQKQAPLANSQQEEWQPFLSGNMSSVEVLAKEDLQATQEKIEKEERGGQPKLKTN